MSFFQLLAIAVTVLNAKTGIPGNCRNGGMGGLTQPYREDDQLLYNFANIGAFVQETIVNENQCIPIPKEMPLASASLIGCGVINRYWGCL